MRPRATIIVAEQQFKNRSISATLSFGGEHLGGDVGRREAARFKAELMAAIKQIVDNDAVDSPVYTFLRLEPPAEGARPRGAPPRPDVAAPEQNANCSTSRAPRWRAATSNARRLLETMLQMRPRDEYVVQQLALATDRRSRTRVARSLPRASICVNSTPTSRTILKRWDSGAPSISGCGTPIRTARTRRRNWRIRARLLPEAGLLQRHQSRVSLERRAALNREGGDKSEAIADFVVARRVRREVIGAVSAHWRLQPIRPPATGSLRRCGRPPSVSAMLRWPAMAKEAEAAAEAVGAVPWMLETTRSQLDRLSKLLAESFSATV